MTVLRAIADYLQLTLWVLAIALWLVLLAVAAAVAWAHRVVVGAR